MHQSIDQFSCLVVYDSLQPYKLQHARPPCPSPTPGVHPNPCPLSRWCHPAISSSVVPFSSCPQSFPASGSFPVSQLFASGGQSIGASTSTSVLPMNTQDWSLLGWTGWLCLKSCIGISGSDHCKTKILLIPPVTSCHKWSIPLCYKLTYSPKFTEFSAELCFRASVLGIWSARKYLL